MTLCGFNVSGLDRAWLWSDCESYGADGRARLASKLSVNASFAVAGCGCGTMGMVDEGAAAVHRTESLDDLALAVHDAMANVFLGPRRVAEARDTISFGAFAAVGWSRRLGRIAGMVWRGPDFEGRLAHSWASPHIDDEVADVHSALAAAQAQLELVRRELPLATGGALVVAEITPERVVIHPRIDLVTGLPLHRPPAPPKDRPSAAAAPLAGEAAA